MEIFLDSLSDGKIEVLDREVKPDFLEISEKELIFTDPVKISGKAYISDDNLILQFSAKTVVTLPCIICNKLFKFHIGIENISHVESLSNIKSQTFCFSKIIRESLILELPLFAECSNGLCPERSELSKFLKTSNDNQFPFANLE